MVSPLLMAGIAAGAHGLDVGLGGMKARRAKKRLHKFRDLLIPWILQQYSEKSPLISRAKERAGEQLRSGYRTRGTYSPEIVAKQLAELEMESGERLAELQTGLTTQALQTYEGMRRGLPVAPDFDITGAVLGGMGLMQAGQPGAVESYIAGQQKPIMGESYKRWMPPDFGQFMKPKKKAGG